MTPKGRFAAVVCAAGHSVRMGGRKKEYLLLPGSRQTVLGASVAAFAALPDFSFIAITVPLSPDMGETAAREALPTELFSEGKPLLAFVPGGKTRRASVYHALNLLAAYPVEYVLIHDGARPRVSSSLIKSVMEAVLVHGAALPVLPLTDTPKELDGKGFVKRHLPRSLTGVAQTPQGFRFPDILEAHKKAAEKEAAEGREYTDDAEIWAEFCGPVAAVPGEAANKKITFPEDLA
ncbi:MAG: 2-C-methyl-D-erythritol 4-phosphate cytidylyltransferase [Treponema sp.]|nr:2-C-methyl-D-erythritol 4-phosphate cytidylyltransferase [Treponema sp.]